MRPFYKSRLLVACFVCPVAVANAQQTQSTAPLTAVPRLVRFTGFFHPPASQPAGMIGATFAVYGQQEGGTPLWTEDQNVELDASGNYTVLLGSTKNGGVPLELFAGGESRWLQVKFYESGEVDLPRVLLVSVPYALKAGDADTLGGKPASAFLLAGPSTLVQPEGSSAAVQPAQSATSVSAMTAAAVVPATTTPDYIARFTSTAGALGNSAIYQKGSNIGVGTKTPGATLEVNGNAQVDGGSILASGSAPVIQFPANGSNNFSAGLSALPPTTTGTSNTAVGAGALQSNSTGHNNTAIGNAALRYNTTGGSNTATGVAALLANTTGNGSVADGNSALYSNTTGTGNVAVGTSAMLQSITGSWNVSAGNASMYNTTTGSNNTAIGNATLFNNTTGSNNVVLGGGAGNGLATTSNNIEIGNNGAATDSGAIRIGTVGTQTSAFIAGIAGVTLPTANEPLVCIDPPTGQLGTVNCASNGAASVQQQQQIQAQAQQIADLQQRLSRLESLIANK